METILFQGDSITDAGRSRDNDAALGGGYPMFVRARLGVDYPQAYRVLNRGVSGNRVVDLYARIKIDFINLHPDLISIMIGVNDVWHEFGNQNGVDAVKFERIYDMLMTELREALPETKFIIMEPYLLHGTGTDDKFEKFRYEVGLRAEASRRIADKFGTYFLPLQETLDRAAATTDSAAYWIADGVHPTAFGHELIAREWVRLFETIR